MQAEDIENVLCLAYFHFHNWKIMHVHTPSSGAWGSPRKFPKAASGFDGRVCHQPTVALARRSQRACRLWQRCLLTTRDSISFHFSAASTVGAGCSPVLTPAAAGDAERLTAAASDGLYGVKPIPKIQALTYRLPACQQMGMKPLKINITGNQIWGIV